MILLTGTSGFIGTHLLSKLIEIYGNENIVALTSKPITACKYILSNDYNFDEDYFIRCGFENIETIIHAGAYTPKASSEGNNIGLCNSNITSTGKLLTSNLPKIKNFVFFSTLDVYGYDNPITEETQLLPASLYGHSKLYCEQMISAWAVQKEICHQILRIGHVYGEGEEKYQKIIPLTIQRLLSETPLQIYEEGEEIRSFIYITDVIDAIMNSLVLNKFAGIINVVGDEKISIYNLIKKLILISGMSPKINKIQAKNAPRDLVFNNSKMKEILGTPKVGIKEGLINEWNYMKNLSK